MYIEICIIGDNNSTTCDPQYIGCYVDDRNRDLKHGPGASGSWKWNVFWSVTTCNDQCQEYIYFSLQFFGRECFCGNAYASSYQYQKRNDSECGGENGVGRTWTNSIYKTCGNENYCP